MKFSLACQALILAAFSLLPGVGQAIYFRDKISWQSPIPPSELVSVDQARAWGDGAIWVDARPSEDFAREPRDVAERLRKEAQLPDVFVLEGGWEAWLKKKR